MQTNKIKIAVVVSEFNTEITSKLQEGAISTLLKNEVLEENIKLIQVPGAIEIPLIAKVLAQKNKYSAIICLGCVIRGETTHYDYVCQQVSYGCQKIMLEFSLPVIFGVLTTENEKQAFARLDESKEGHKGIDAANTALQMISILKKIE